MPQPPITPPRRITPGLLSAADAAEINRWAELLYRLALEREPELSAGTEPLRDLDSPTGFWARIEGDALADGRHSWREVVPTFPDDQSGNFPVVWQDYSRSSSFGGTPAYEASGGTAPPGSIVWMQFSPDRRRFIFERPDSSLPTEQPTDPSPGDQYFDPVTGIVYIWNGTIWVKYSPIYYNPTDNRFYIDDVPHEPGAECPPISFTQYQSRCETIDLVDYMVRYKRQVTLEFVDGCLKWTFFSWEFDRKLASGVTCEGSEPPPPPPDEDCCPGTTVLPDNLTLEFHGPTGDCECLTFGNPVTLPYDADNDRWQATFSVCSGETTTIALYCVEGEPPYFALELSGSCSTGGALAADSDPAPTCDPPCIEWTDLSVSGGCTGTISATIGCAAGDVQTSCCANALPATLRATFLDMGGCACVDGQQLDLVYNAVSSKWEGTLTGHGCDDMTLAFYCDSGTSQFLLDVSGCGVSPGATATATVCDPLDVDFEFAEQGTCCGAGGGGNFTVSIGPVPAP